MKQTALTVENVKKNIETQKQKPFFGWDELIEVAFVSLLVGFLCGLASVTWKTNDAQTFATWQTTAGFDCPYDQKNDYVLSVGCRDGKRIRDMVKALSQSEDYIAVQALREKLDKEIADSNLDIENIVSNQEREFVIAVVNGMLPIPKEWQEKPSDITVNSFIGLSVALTILFFLMIVGVKTLWRRRAIKIFNMQRESIRASLDGDLRDRFDIVIVKLERLHVLRETSDDEEKEKIKLLDQQAKQLIERLIQVIVLQVERESMSREEELCELKKEFSVLQAELEGSLAFSGEINRQRAQEVQDQNMILEQCPVSDPTEELITA